MTSYKWVLNKAESETWRKCALRINVPLPQEMVEHIVFYLYDKEYIYSMTDRALFMVLLWMCGDKELYTHIRRDIIDTMRYSPLEVANEILLQYTLNPEKIIANTETQLMQWYTERIEMYHETLKSLT